MESVTRILHEPFAESTPATASVDVLIPTYGRPAALAVTLTALTAQTFRDFRVIISDQHESDDAASAGEVQAVLRVLEARGHQIEIHKHLPRRGMAEQRQFLLDCAEAPYVLFLDDDVIVESDLLERLVTTLQQTGCGFVGSAVIGLSYARDVRPHQQQIEFWEGDVTPEQIRPGMPEWDRHLLHNAANLYHVAGQLGLTATNARIYRIAWVGGCRAL